MLSLASPLADDPPAASLMGFFSAIVEAVAKKLSNLNLSQTQRELWSGPTPDPAVVARARADASIIGELLKKNRLGDSSRLLDTYSIETLSLVLKDTLQNAEHPLLESKAFGKLLHHALPPSVLSDHLQEVSEICRNFNDLKALVRLLASTTTSSAVLAYKFSSSALLPKEISESDLINYSRTAVKIMQVLIDEHETIFPVEKKDVPRRVESLYTVEYGFEPETPAEMRISPGDVLDVTQRDPDGWWQGTNTETGKSGMFPGDYVSKMVEHHDDENKSHSRNSSNKRSSSKQRRSSREVVSLRVVSAQKEKYAMLERELKSQVERNETLVAQLTKLQKAYDELKLLHRAAAAVSKKSRPRDDDSDEDDESDCSDVSQAAPPPPPRKVKVSVAAVPEIEEEETFNEAVVEQQQKEEEEEEDPKLALMRKLGLSEEQIRAAKARPSAKAIASASPTQRAPTTTDATVKPSANAFAAALSRLTPVEKPEKKASATDAVDELAAALQRRAAKLK